MKKHVVVLGAGVSGLSAAWRLSGKGAKVDVLESDSLIGGLAGTFRINDYCLDFGPHSFFSDDKKIVDMVLGLFDYKLQPKKRRVKFFYKGGYIDYPFTAKSILFQMGFDSATKAALSFLKEKILPSRKRKKEEHETVEDWAISSFGKYLYKTFFKPYTEQFWKISCSELSSRSIPTHARMSLANTLNFLLPRKSESAAKSLLERETLPTYYPDTGFGEIAERMAENIKKSGGEIYVGCNVLSVEELANKKIRILYENDKRKKEVFCDYVISTIPLTALIEIINPPVPPDILESASKLYYRPLMVLGMATEKKNILKCEYLYMLDRPYNRIFEMSNFSSLTSPPGKNIIAVEISCLKDSDLWGETKEEIFELCISSLEKDGFLTAKDVKDLFFIKAPYAYPIYSKNYKMHLDKLNNYLNKYDSLATLGRSGEFMYMDVDICIKRAINFIDQKTDKFK